MTWVRLKLRHYWLAPSGTAKPVRYWIGNAETEDTIVQQDGSVGGESPFSKLGRVPGKGASTQSS